MHIRKLKLLTDVLTAGDAIERHLQNTDFSTYLENELLRGFCERKLLIVGEALARLRDLDSEAQSEINEIHLIVGLRNRVVHSYDSVDDRIIWDALVNHLPSLLDQVRNTLPKYEP